MVSCSDVYEEIIILDIGEYNSIWSLPERSVNETSLLFPDEVSEEQCITFTCIHITYQLVGTGWQISLQLKYDDLDFENEINRLRSLSVKSPVKGYSEYFDDLAFAFVWNWNGCFEYAVVDEKEKAICYIYLQLINKSSLTIDERCIPKGYEMQLTDVKAYSIYEE